MANVKLWTVTPKDAMGLPLIARQQGVPFGGVVMFVFATAKEARHFAKTALKYAPSVERLPWDTELAAEKARRGSLTIAESARVKLIEAGAVLP